MEPEARFVSLESSGAARALREQLREGPIPLQRMLALLKGEEDPRISPETCEEGLRYLELVWSKSPGHENVAQHLKREYLTRGLEAFAAGRLDEAVSMWEKAQRVDPSDDRARAYLARAQEHIDRTMQIRGSN